MENNTKITSIDELRKYSSGTIVNLPPFNEGQPFVARLKRPSMMSLVKTGKIPNSLLQSANSLFEKGPAGTMHASSIKTSELTEDVMSQMFDVMDIICEAAFVEPTYHQIKEAGVELTDEQLLFIFGYTQQGLKELDSFR